MPQLQPQVPPKTSGPSAQETTPSKPITKGREEEEYVSPLKDALLRRIALDEGLPDASRGASGLPPVQESNNEEEDKAPSAGEKAARAGGAGSAS